MTVTQRQSELPGPGQAGPAIVAEGLTKRYGKITAVDGLSFSVRPGAVTEFFGPNGAGKTTAMRLVLQAHPELAVVGEAADGHEALLLAESLHPDVILMDIRRPRLDGVEAVARLTAARLDPSPRVLMLTTFDLAEYVSGRCGPGRPGSCSRTARGNGCWRRFTSSMRGRLCCHPRSPAG